MHTKSPLMRQVDHLRQEAPEGALLAVDMGTSYYFFGEDARTYAHALKKKVETRGEVLVCGFTKCNTNYDIPILIRNGYTVCTCDIMEPIDKNRRGGVLRREITRTFKPNVNGLNENV